MHKHLVQDAQTNIDILINFSASNDIKFQHSAYWVLKDYIMLNHDNLIPDISNLIKAFMNGCLSEEQNIQTECANAISFLVTHRLVYKKIEEEDRLKEKELTELVEKIKVQPVEYILDAIMYLSGNILNSIRTTAFSTLSQLSKFSSMCKTVMAQI